MIWTLAVLLFIGSSVSDSPQRILERMRTAQSGLQSLKARVEQVKSYAKQHQHPLQCVMEEN